MNVGGPPSCSFGASKTCYCMLGRSGTPLDAIKGGTCGNNFRHWEQWHRWDENTRNAIIYQTPPLDMKTVDNVWRPQSNVLLNSS